MPTNDSYGRRTRFGGQAGRGGSSSAHPATILIAAVEHEEEEFGTRDLPVRRRVRPRPRRAAAPPSSANGARDWGDRLTTDVARAPRRFQRFEDATTLRAATLSWRSAAACRCIGGYGEGIAQPSFFDLFGFFPGSGFVGNPALRPERSEGLEAGLRWATAGASARGGRLLERPQRRDRRGFQPVFPTTPSSTRPARAGAAASSCRANGGRAQGCGSPPTTPISTRDEPAGAGDGAAARGAAARAQRQSSSADWRTGPVTIGAVARLCRRADRHATSTFSRRRGSSSTPMCWRARASPIGCSDALEAYARVENGFDERLSGRGRLRHAGTDGPCGPSRRFWPISLALAPAPRRRPSSAGGAPRRVASLNLCTDELLLLLAEPEQIASVTPSRAASRRRRRLWRQARRYRAQRRQPALGRRRCGPIWC